MDLSSADQRENPHPTDGFDRVCLAVRVVRGGPARGQRISVEMFLKAGLSRQITLDDLKNPTNFGHDLLKLWPAFKAQFATAGELDEFDATVTKLEKFEDFRYPEKILALSSQMLVDWTALTMAHSFSSWPPLYHLHVNDLDRLVATLLVDYGGRVRQKGARTEGAADRDRSPHRAASEGRGRLSHYVGNLDFSGLSGR